jgi:lysophospholipase L1-like esterase
MRWTRIAVAGAAVAIGAIAGAIAVDQRNERSRRVAVGKDSIVLLGDSITAEGDWNEHLAGLPVVNAGRSGFTTEELVSVAGEDATAQPRKVVILTGTNDIRDHRQPSWTRRHLEELIGVVQRTSPATRIVVQTILPRSDRVAEVVATNEAIRSLAIAEGVELLDLYAVFDDGSGALRRDETYDGVHLGARGYERWATALRTILPESRPT